MSGLSNEGVLFPEMTPPIWEGHVLLSEIFRHFRVYFNNCSFLLINR
jgi:hypothetical protein